MITSDPLSPILRSLLTTRAYHRAILYTPPIICFVFGTLLWLRGNLLLISIGIVFLQVLH